MTAAASRSPRAILSELKYRTSARLSPRLCWYLMGRLSPVRAVTSHHSTVEASMASGREVVGLLRDLDVVDEDAVTLHVGSGLGRVEQHLAPLVRWCYGADVSSSMVRRARRLVRHDNVEFVVTNGRDLSPWRNASLQLVYSFFVFQHLPRAQFGRYVREARAKLVPGGRLVFQLMVDESGSHPEPLASHPYALRYYRRADVLGTLSAAGFVDIVAVDQAGSDLVFCATAAP